MFDVVCSTHECWLEAACVDCGRRPGLRTIYLGNSCVCGRAFAGDVEQAPDLLELPEFLNRIGSDGDLELSFAKFGTYADLVAQSATIESASALPTGCEQAWAAVITDRDASSFKLKRALEDPKAMAAIGLLLADLYLAETAADQ